MREIIKNTSLGMVLILSILIIIIDNIKVEYATFLIGISLINYVILTIVQTEQEKRRGKKLIENNIVLYTGTVTSLCWFLTALTQEYVPFKEIATLGFLTAILLIILGGKKDVE